MKATEKVDRIRFGPNEAGNGLMNISFGRKLLGKKSSFQIVNKGDEIPKDRLNASVREELAQSLQDILSMDGVEQITVCRTHLIVKATWKDGLIYRIIDVLGRRFEGYSVVIAPEALPKEPEIEKPTRPYGPSWYEKFFVGLGLEPGYAWVLAKEFKECPEDHEAIEALCRTGFISLINATCILITLKMQEESEILPSWTELGKHTRIMLEQSKPVGEQIKGYLAKVTATTKVGMTKEEAYDFLIAGLPTMKAREISSSLDILSPKDLTALLKKAGRLNDQEAATAAYMIMSMEHRVENPPGYWYQLGTATVKEFRLRRARDTSQKSTGGMAKLCLYGQLSGFNNCKECPVGCSLVSLTGGTRTPTIQGVIADLLSARGGMGKPDARNSFGSFAGSRNPDNDVVVTLCGTRMNLAEAEALIANGSVPGVPPQVLELLRRIKQVLDRHRAEENLTGHIDIQLLDMKGHPMTLEGARQVAEENLTGFMDIHLLDMDGHPMTLEGAKRVAMRSSKRCGCGAVDCQDCNR